MPVSSDPHYWLRPFYVRLRHDSAFLLLSLSHQFEALCRAVEPEQPGKAATMREWSPAAQTMLLHHLASIVDQVCPEPEVELWRARKDGRELRCVAVHLPTGIDVRLIEGDDFRRTQLCKTAPEVKLADGWRDALVAVGWTLSQAAGL